MGGESRTPSPIDFGTAAGEYLLRTSQRRASAPGTHPEDGCTQMGLFQQPARGAGSRRATACLRRRLRSAPASARTCALFWSRPTPIHDRCASRLWHSGPRMASGDPASSHPLCVDAPVFLPCRLLARSGRVKSDENDRVPSYILLFLFSRAPGCYDHAVRSEVHAPAGPRGYSPPARGCPLLVTAAPR
jgi:hypothetical protein